MPRIPIEKRPQITPDPGQPAIRSTMSARAASAPGRAIQGVGQVIGQISDELHSQQMEAFQMENETNLAQADLYRMQGELEFNAKKAEEPNAQNWPGIFKSINDRVNKEVGTLPFSEKYKTRADSNHNEWATKMTGKIAEATGRQRVNEWFNTMEEVRDLHIKQGNTDAALIVQNHINEKLGASVEQSSMNLLRVQEQTAHSRAIVAQRADPWQFGEDAKNGMWDILGPEALTGMLNRNDGLIRQEQTNYFNTIVDDLVPGFTLDNEALDKKEQEGRILAGQKVAYRRIRDQEFPNLGEIVEIHEALISLEPSPDGMPTQKHLDLWAKLRTVPEPYLEPFKRRFNRLIDPQSRFIGVLLLWGLLLE